MRLVLVATLALCATAAASGQATAAAEPPDPCQLITVKDATPVFGTAPAKPSTKTRGVFRACTYTVKHETMTVETRLLASQSAFVTATKRSGLALPIETLSDAYSVDSGREMLLWKKGVEITFSFAGFNPVFATQATLASAALGGV